MAWESWGRKTWHLENGTNCHDMGAPFPQHTLKSTILLHFMRTWGGGGMRTKMQRGKMRIILWEYLELPKELWCCQDDQRKIDYCQQKLLQVTTLVWVYHQKIWPQPSLNPESLLTMCSSGLDELEMSDRDTDVGVTVIPSVALQWIVLLLPEYVSGSYSPSYQWEREKINKFVFNWWHN